MSKLNLVFLDNDEEYIDKLSTYILQKSPIFNVTCLSDNNNLEEYLQNHTVDILIVAPNLFNQNFFYKKLSFLTMVFSDSHFNTLSDIDFPLIKKYQKSDCLINAIHLKYAEYSGNKSIITKNSGVSKVITSYSSVGSIGKTTILSALCYLASSHSQKVLYISFETFNNSMFFYDNTIKCGLSELFLQVKEKNSSLPFNILKYASTETTSGISYFIPPESALEFNELSSEEIYYLFDELKKLRNYDIIFVDLDSNLSSNTQTLLNISDKIIMPLADTNHCLNKTTHFIKEINLHSDLSTINSKLIPFFNMTASPELKEKYADLIKNMSNICIPRINTLSNISSLSALSQTLSPYVNALYNSL